MQVPFFKPYLDEKEQKAAATAIKRNMIGFGPIVSTFEKEFARYVGASYAVAVNSCSAALHLAVVGMGIGEGDEVIVTPLTFSATLYAILYSGATPVMADIDIETNNISPESIRSKITKRTKAVMIVHHGGIPCDMKEIIAICNEYHLKLIEDAAHALPSKWDDHMIGEDRPEIENAVCFSFQATKTLSIGDGGMICTWNKELADVLKMKRLFGMRRMDDDGKEIDIALQYGVEMEGYKYNMTDVEAAIGRVQLGKLEKMQEMRERIASRYLKGLCNCKQIALPNIQSDIKNSWHLFSIRILQENVRDKFRSFLAENGISTSIHFIPLYRFPYFKNILGTPFGKDSNIEKVADNIVSLPIYPSMSDEECDFVITTIQQFFNR